MTALFLFLNSFRFIEKISVLFPSENVSLLFQKKVVYYK